MNSFDSQKKTPEEEIELTETVAEEAAPAVETAEAPTDVVEEVTEEKPASKKKLSSKFNWKTNRKLRIGTTATAVTAAVVAVVVLLNVVVGILNDRFPWSLDLTADKTYTLSEKSHEVAEKVKKDVTITVFANQKLFENPSYGNELDVILRQFYRFTTEYGTLTDGKVKTAYVDLDANPTLATEYTKYGVNGDSILFQCGEQWRVVGMEDLYSVDDSNYYYTGEYSISSLVEQKLATNINAVCGGKTVTVTFLTGHGENTSGISMMKDLYEMNGYTVDTVDFTTASVISDATQALVIMGASKDFTLDEIGRLRAWLHNDGKRNRHLYVYCNYVASCPNLYEFLEADYGITVTGNLLFETDSNNMPASGYDNYPLTTPTETKLTTDIGELKALMPNTLQLITSKGSDTNEEYLINQALVTFPESTKLVNMEEINNLSEEEKKEMNLDSFKKDAESYPVIGMAYAYDYTYNSDNEEVGNYIVVSGSYEMVGSLTSSFYSNEELVLLPMRTTCSLGDTTVISGKELSTDTVTFTYGTALFLGLGVFTLGVPAILVIICLVVFFKRRHL